jgi:hypothetical protein
MNRLNLKGLIRFTGGPEAEKAFILRRKSHLTGPVPDRQRWVFLKYPFQTGQQGDMNHNLSIPVQLPAELQDPGQQDNMGKLRGSEVRIDKPERQANHKKR